MKIIKAVFFNLDDTLFDNRYSCREGLRVVWKRYTCFHSMTIDEMEAEYTRLLEELRFSHVIFGKLTQEEIRDEIFKFLFLNRGVEIDYHTAHNAAVLFRNKYVSNRRTVRGAEELLKALSGKFRIGVITNNSDAEYTDKISFTGFDKYINSYTTSQETGVGKPTRRIFKIAMEKLEASPEESIMIGNNWNWDILGAYETEMKCIWLNLNGKPTPDRKIADEIRSLDDTENILSLIERN
ncbi:MAG: HAD family hydrolase [Ignavibacteria bacterium]